MGASVRLESLTYEQRRPTRLQPSERLMPFEPELAAALDAAQKAGLHILTAYKDFVAIPNARADITTHVDRESQELILTHLHSVFPADALCAEETTPALQGAPQTGARLWIVDPIDGTRGFAKKNGEFSVMIGFVAGGAVAVGVVLEPATSRLTYASLGGGCWKRDANAAPVRCRVTETSELKSATLTQSHSKPGAKSDPENALAPARVVEKYSAGLKLALVARGDVDIYVNTYQAFHDWDICAGHLLVDEAGGKVSGLGGQTLRYGIEGAWQRHGLIATNGRLHEPALERLRA
jgi:3'(2'), 5'-bisphosphate nucleotidase